MTQYLSKKNQGNKLFILSWHKVKLFSTGRIKGSELSADLRTKDVSSS